MLRSVPLSRLPQGLTFPTQLQGRIRYDHDKRQLQYDGFMSKTDFDVLVQLHNDLEYQRALEHLLQICVFEPQGASGHSSAKIVYVGLAAAAIVLLCTCSLFLLLK